MTDLSTYFENGVSAIEADVFNGWGAEVQGVRDTAVEAAVRAENAAAEAAAPADDQVATLLVGPSLTDATLRALTTPRTAAGPYASRPAASTLPGDTVFRATDVPEEYRGDGTAWTVIGSGGNELASAEVVTNPVTITPTTAGLIPGLAATFKVGERPAVVSIEVRAQMSAATVNGMLTLVVDGSGRATVITVPTAQIQVIRRSLRLSGLTPGSTHSVSVYAEILSGTTGNTFAILGSATDPTSLRVETI